MANENNSLLKDAQYGASPTNIGQRFFIGARVIENNFYDPCAEGANPRERLRITWELFDRSSGLVLYNLTQLGEIGRAYLEGDEDTTPLIAGFETFFTHPDYNAFCEAYPLETYDNVPDLNVSRAKLRVATSIGKAGNNLVGTTQEIVSETCPDSEEAFSIPLINDEVIVEGVDPHIKVTPSVVNNPDGSTTTTYEVEHDIDLQAVAYSVRFARSNGTLLGQMDFDFLGHELEGSQTIQIPTGIEGVNGDPWIAANITTINGEDILNLNHILPNAVAVTLREFCYPSVGALRYTVEGQGGEFDNNGHFHRNVSNTRRASIQFDEKFFDHTISGGTTNKTLNVKLRPVTAPQTEENVELGELVTDIEIDGVQIKGVKLNLSLKVIKNELGYVIGIDKADSDPPEDDIIEGENCTNP